MSTDLKSRKAALFARTPDAALVMSLPMIEQQITAGVPGTEETQNLIMVRAWTIEEVERRFPEADAAAQAAFAVSDAEWQAWDGTGEPPADVDYVAVLLSAIKI